MGWERRALRCERIKISDIDGVAQVAVRMLRNVEGRLKGIGGKGSGESVATAQRSGIVKQSSAGGTIPVGSSRRRGARVEHVGKRVDRDVRHGSILGWNGEAGLPGCNIHEVVDRRKGIGESKQIRAARSDVQVAVFSGERIVGGKGGERGCRRRRRDLVDDNGLGAQVAAGGREPSSS